MKKASTEIYYQGTRGKQLNKMVVGVAMIEIDQNAVIHNKITVDSFEGQGDKYVRRDESLITIDCSDESDRLFQGTFEELKRVLKHYKDNCRVCIIDNGQFSYTMTVDGKFVGTISNWKYFAKHYFDLGYRIRMTSTRLPMDGDDNEPDLRIISNNYNPYINE